MINHDHRVVSSIIPHLLLWLLCPGNLRPCCLCCLLMASQSHMVILCWTFLTLICSHREHFFSAFTSLWPFSQIPLSSSFYLDVPNGGLPCPKSHRLFNVLPTLAISACFWIGSNLKIQEDAHEAQNVDGPWKLERSESAEETSPVDTSTSVLWNKLQSFALQNCKRITLCYFKPLNLW